MNNKNLIRAAERISAIEFNLLHRQNYVSYQLLAQEFLERAALVIHKYSIKLKTLRYPFISAYDVLNKELDIDVSEWCPKIEEIQDGTIKYMCQYYLQWSILIDLGIPAALENTDLYDPLIQLLERGGSFTIRQNSMIVGEAELPLAIYKEMRKNEANDISIQHLDQMDLDQDMEVIWGNEDGIVISSHFKHSKNRIYNLRFSSKEEDLESHVVLLNEFLRRMAYYQRYSYLNIDSPFINVAETLGYTATLNVKELFPDLYKFTNELTELVCKNYLELSALVDQGVLRARKYYNVYEPLIKLFERGGEIDLVDNNIVVGSTIVPLSDWYVYAMTRPEYDISIESLNALDS